jgi:uncharacterized membrane protein
MALFWIAFYFLFPVLVIYMVHRFPVLKNVGGVVMCYIAGLLLGNLAFLTGDRIDLLPRHFSGTQDIIFIVTIGLALPLIFFSIDVRKWSRLAGKSLLSFGLETVAVIISASTGYLIFKNWIGGETWKVGGMLIGCYTGGTVNLAAIGTALDVNKTVFASAQISDVAVGALYLLLVITVLQRILLKFLPAFKPSGTEEEKVEIQDYDNYEGFFSREKFVPLLGGFGLAVLIVVVGLAATFIFPKDWEMMVAVLVVCTLGILASFSSRVRRIPMTYQLGQYFILVFVLVIASMSDLEELFSTTPAMLGLVAWAVFVALFLHVLFASFFKIDADTVIITSVAGVMSPPFVPMVAAALKNKEIIVTGVVTGVIGWVVGTYLGIGIAYVIKMF